MTLRKLALTLLATLIVSPEIAQAQVVESRPTDHLTIALKKGDQTTTVEIPVGSKAIVGPKGNVEIQLADGETANPMVKAESQVGWMIESKSEKRRRLMQPL